MDLKKNILEKLNILLELNKKLCNIYKINNDTQSKTLLFKIQNYNKWITNITLMNDDIFKKKETLFDSIKSSSLKKKIQEILNTNTLQDIIATEKIIFDLEKKQIIQFNSDKTNKNNDFKTIDSIDIVNLVKISGIGENTALKLLKKKITLEHLLEEFNSLENKELFKKYKKIEDLFRFYSGNNRNSFIKDKLKHTTYLKQLNYGQMVGLKYFKDIQERIPRKEIEDFEKLINLILKKKENIIFQICGSFRRGKETSGDIDILISNKENNKSCILSFVKILIELDILVDHLTINGENKYMGIGKLPSKKYKTFRRIDIKFVEMESYSASLLYFTGSANLNKEMRRKAIQKGYKLNEYGLYKKDNNEKLNTPDEKSIFNFLEMDYLNPINRNI